MRKTLVTVLLAASAVTAVSATAFAQSPHHRTHLAASESSLDSNALTVNRRSWLDPGPGVSQGFEQHYMGASTQFATTQDRQFGQDRYGNDTMQGQPYVPGRTVPVVEFSTLPNGGVEVDNTIGAQNYYFNPAPAVPAQAPALVTNSDDVVPLQ